jgi:phenylalanyl-tRNA synthetase beta chain
LAALPKYPAVERDLSLVVAKGVRYEELNSLIRNEGVEHLEDVSYLSTFSGSSIPAGLKSVTFRLVFRAVDRTLTSAEVEHSLGELILRAGAKLGASLRA